MFSIAVQKKNGTAQSFRLAFHEKNKAGEYVHQRRVGRDHFQHAALSSAKEFFLFDWRDVAANDYATQQLAVEISQGSTINPGPKSLGRFLVPNEYFNIVYLFTANRSGQGQLIVRKQTSFVR